MTEGQEALARYKKLRQAAMQVNSRLMKLVPKSALDEGGKALGFLQEGVLVFESEDETSVLIDYCIYDVRTEGKTAIDRFLEESPPPAGSDELVLLEAMREAEYCLLKVEGNVRGAGVHVRDLLRNEGFFLSDIGFSVSAVPGFVLASRVITADGVNMTSGAALPVNLPPGIEMPFLARLAEDLGVKSFHDLAPEKSSALAATLICGALQQGGSERIRYARPGQVPQALPGGGVAKAVPPRRVGPNARCPCGSGRKFKVCCGANR
jgi:hypothetical protein